MSIVYWGQGGNVQIFNEGDLRNVEGEDCILIYGAGSAYSDLSGMLRERID